jgi:hypothetical protein
MAGRSWRVQAQERAVLPPSSGALISARVEVARAEEREILLGIRLRTIRWSCGRADSMWVLSGKRERKPWVVSFWRLLLRHHKTLSRHLLIYYRDT